MKPKPKLKPKPLTAIQKYNAIQNIGTEIEVPYDVWRLFGADGKQISIMSNQISLGEDYASPDEAREAIEWFVTQLGGVVFWGLK